jgi:hypothetical protein
MCGLFRDCKCRSSLYRNAISPTAEQGMSLVACRARAAARCFLPQEIFVIVLASQLCSNRIGALMKYDLELELTDDDLFELKSALELSRYLAQQYGNDDRRERCQELQKKLDASERKFRKNGHNGK